VKYLLDVNALMAPVKNFIDALRQETLLLVGPT